jgi:hypothetical protein
VAISRVANFLDNILGASLALVQETTTPEQVRALQDAIELAKQVAQDPRITEHFDAILEEIQYINTKHPELHGISVKVKAYKERDEDPKHQNPLSPVEQEEFKNLKQRESAILTHLKELRNTAKQYITTDYPQQFALTKQKAPVRLRAISPTGLALQEVINDLIAERARLQGKLDDDDTPRDDRAKLSKIANQLDNTIKQITITLNDYKEGRLPKEQVVENTKKHFGQLQNEVDKIDIGQTTGFRATLSKLWNKFLKAIGLKDNSLDRIIVQEQKHITNPGLYFTTRKSLPLQELAKARTSIAPNPIPNPPKPPDSRKPRT